MASRSYFSPGGAWSLGAFLFVGAVAGVLVATGGPISYALIGLSLTLPALAVMSWRPLQFEHRGYLRVEVPLVALLLATLVLRIRDAEAVATTPIDSAGLFRVACIGFAFLLSILNLISPGDERRGRLVSPPIRLFIAYIAVVCVGAAFSKLPYLTAYRAVELTVAVMVVLGAWHADREAARRALKVLFWFAVALLMSVWVGVLTDPGLALERVAPKFRTIATPLPVQLQGIRPVLSSNLIGTLSVLVMLWSIGRLLYRQPDERIPIGALRVLAAFGAITLVGAQYRTGYVAAIVGIGLIVLMRKRFGLAIAFAGIALLVLAQSGGPPEQLTRFVLRGQNVETVSGLTGRVEWWESSIPVIKSSPLIGRGLLTATRFEVLAPLGHTLVSTIHSTWIEALVGAGIIGTSLLAIALLMVWRRALKTAAWGNMVPGLILTVISVRSITGDTFESFSYMCVLFLVLAQSSYEEAHPAAVARSSAHDPPIAA